MSYAIFPLRNPFIREVKLQGTKSKSSIPRISVN
jgi:hypothetical protein